MKETPEYVVHPKLRVTSTQQSHHVTFIFINGYNMHNLVAMLSFPFFMDFVLGSNPKFSSNKNRGTYELTGNNHSHHRLNAKPLLLNPSLMLSSQ